MFIVHFVTLYLCNTFTCNFIILHTYRYCVVTAVFWAFGADLNYLFHLLKLIEFFKDFELILKPCSI